MSRSTALALVVLSVIGAGTIHGLSVNNGLYHLINASKAQGILPDAARTPYKGTFTGVGTVDDLLAGLVAFFWPVVNGGSDRAGLGLMGLLFAGQSCAALTILMIEGLRKGNEGRAVGL
jgi:hypothetical protein